MTDITHWADVVANEVLARGKKHLVATGITPSGQIHIGNMREVVTADAAYRALVDKGAEAEFIYIADTYDPLRKVYPFLDESYAEHVGKPLSEVPCPCKKHKSYSEHFLEPFLEALVHLGIHPKVYRADELYKQGVYTDSIKKALVERDKIAKILEDISGKSPAETWNPFNPICSACGKINATIVTGFDLDAETVDYKCSCGNSGTVSMNGGGKLTWRVDWPARWGALGVTVEPYGKDHASSGGSYDTGVPIAKEVFGYDAPFPVVYEWIMLGNEGAMSSSTGVVVSIADMLKVVPPEVLRYLIIRTKPEKHIRFDPGQPLLTLVDDYERLQAMEEPGPYEKRIMELSYAEGICRTDIPFKHMTTIYQAASGDFEKIMRIVRRAGYDTSNEKCIRALADNVGNWLEMYAPAFAKFSVKEDLPVQAASLSELQRAFLSSFSSMIAEKDELSGEEYHNLVYSAKEQDSELNKRMADALYVNPDEVHADPKDLFKAIYTAVLGQQSGPKAGWFLSSLEKDFLVRRFMDAAKYIP